MFRTPGQTIVWHDARLRGLPPGAKRRSWSIPLVLDGQRLDLDGVIWRAHPPALWPWAIIGVVFIALTALVLALRRKPLLRTASAALGTTAAAATLMAAIGFAAFSTASKGRWVEGGDEIVFVLVGLGVVARGSRDARALAGGARSRPRRTCWPTPPPRGRSRHLAAAQAVGLAGELELLGRVLADRLEHRVALVVEAEQALVDEPLEHVQLGGADLLRGRQRAAAGEDREPPEQLLLARREKVVAPRDRRPQRPLPLRRVSRPAGSGRWSSRPQISRTAS
jgi:hypothetical protein